MAYKIKEILREVESKRKTKKVQAKSLIEKGKLQGYLILEELIDAFSETELTEEQIENLYETLGNLGIEVVQYK